MPTIDIRQPQSSREELKVIVSDDLYLEYDSFGILALYSSACSSVVEIDIDELDDLIKSLEYVRDNHV